MGKRLKPKAKQQTVKEDNTEDTEPAPVVKLVLRKKGEHQQQQQPPSKKLKSVAPPPTPPTTTTIHETTETAFDQEMQIEQMAQAWGLVRERDDDDNDEDKIQEEEMVVSRGAGLGSFSKLPVLKKGSLEERVEKSRIKKARQKETPNIELSTWKDEEEEEIVTKSSSSSRSRKTI